MYLELKDITVDIEGKRVLDNICCQIPANRWISIIGKSGAGKSTLLQMMKGLVPFQSGSYKSKENQEEKEMAKHIRKMGLVFQYPEKQLFHTTVYKELAFGLKQKKLSKREINDQIQSSLTQFGLDTAILSKSPFQLSGGQRRRLALASVLITNPDMLLIDEPTAGLDPGARASILQLIKNWQNKENRTVIFISHQMDDVMRYSDEVIVMSDGKVKVQMNTDELFLHHVDIIENSGLMPPLSMQLLRYVEQKTGQDIFVERASETDVFTALREIVGLGSEVSNDV